MAVALLDTKALPALTRILYARQFGITEWMASSFSAVVMSLRPLSEADAENVGWNIAFHIADAQRALITSRIRALQNTLQAGSCVNCYTNYVRFCAPAAAVITAERPADVPPARYLEYVRRELKTRYPSVGTCGAAVCQSWPTDANVASWFNLDAEADIVKMYYDRLL